MKSQTVAKLIGVAILIFVIVIAASTSTYVVEPGYRGIEVTLGKVSPVFKPQGFGYKTPFITTIVPVPIRQQTRAVQAACYSSDLQQVNMDLQVLFRVPEASVVQIYQGYAGDPFDSLIAPRAGSVEGSDGFAKCGTNRQEPRRDQRQGAGQCANKNRVAF